MTILRTEIGTHTPDVYRHMVYETHVDVIFSNVQTVFMLFCSFPFPTPSQQVRIQMCFVY